MTRLAQLKKRLMTKSWMVQMESVPLLENAMQRAPMAHSNRMPHMRLVLVVAHDLLEVDDLHTCQSNMSNILAAFGDNEFDHRAHQNHPDPFLSAVYLPIYAANYLEAYGVCCCQAADLRLAPRRLAAGLSPDYVRIDFLLVLSDSRKIPRIAFVVALVVK